LPTLKKFSTSRIFSWLREFFAAGENEVSYKWGFQLLRDDRDKIIKQPAGSYLEFDTELDGGADFGGDIDRYRLEMRNSSVLQDMRHATSRSSRALPPGGRVPGTGRTTHFVAVPVQKESIGWIRTSRGFEKRDAVPKDDREIPTAAKS